MQFSRIKKKCISAEVNQGGPFKAGSRCLPMKFHPLRGSFQAKEQIATEGDTIQNWGLTNIQQKPTEKASLRCPDG